jgi:type IV secretion system protein VirB10
MEATLETAIVSESEGTVSAVMSRDVYGESGRKILIPKGSRLYGSYTTVATVTQTRLLLTWTKIVRPDNVVITINADTYDQGGKKGIEGDINTRYGELFKNSLLYSFITLGTAVAIEKIAGIKGQTSIVAGNGTSVTNTSPANAAATSVIETAQDIAEKMTKGLPNNLNPIISIRQGMLLKVVSKVDVVVPEEYKREGGLSAID